MTPRFVWLTCALVSAALIGARAEGFAQLVPLSAATELHGGAMADVASWPRWPGTPLRFSTGQFDVVVTTPLSRAWLAAHDDPRVVARSCAGLAVVARDTATGGSIVDWSAARGFTASAADSPEVLAAAVVITIAPITEGDSPCRGHPPQSPGSIAEGVAFQRSAFHNPGADVIGASVSASRSSAPPLRVERATQRMILPKDAHIGAPSQSIVRIFLPPEHFSTDANGVPGSIQVALTRAQDGRSVTFALPLDIRTQVHQDLLVHTIARAGINSAAPDLALPPPSDTGLRRAIERQRSGNTRAAALGYHARLYHSGLDEPDRRETRVRLALSLAALGDSASARAFALQVVGREPCFTLAQTLPPQARALFAKAAGARERCTHDVSGVVARSLLFPGLGHVHADRRTIGVGVALASSAALAYAAKKHSASGDLYDQYVAANSAVEARQWYGRAAASRDDALRGVLVGAALWAVSAVEASLVEMRHADAIRRVRDYGRVGLTAGPMHAPFVIGIQSRW